MKTTIDLPDEVLVKAKVFAAELRTTLRELVVRGLKLVTEAPEPGRRETTQGRAQAFARRDAGQQYGTDGPTESGGNL
jgi:hypothetical protein